MDKYQINKKYFKYSYFFSVAMSGGSFKTVETAN